MPAKHTPGPARRFAAVDNKVQRRHINFVAECYALPTDTFFDLDRTPWAKAYGLAKRMVRRRMIGEEQQRRAAL